MQPCENVWLNIPEGSRIGPHMAALWKSNFAGTGAPPAREELSIIRHWDHLITAPAQTLRQLRATVLAAFASHPDLHPRLFKEKVVTGTADLVVGSPSVDANGNWYIDITFKHPKFRWSEVRSSATPQETLQVHCAGD